MLPFLLGYLILMNALGLVLMYVDKQKARRHRWRIPEATLLTVAALGGSLGMLAGMRLFRHKTRHRKFTIGVPLLLVLQLALAGALLWPALKSSLQTDWNGAMIWVSKGGVCP